jgi:hypothetical protein
MCGGAVALERHTSLFVGFRSTDGNETKNHVCELHPIFGQMGVSPDRVGVSIRIPTK